MSSVYPSIPTPTKDIDSIHNTITALKQAVDILTGQTPAVSSAPPRMFVQRNKPEADKTGDLWYVEGAGNLMIWNGNAWVGIIASSEKPKTREDFIRDYLVRR